MTITSFNFLCFLSIALFFYYIFPKKLQWVLLLVYSIIFYVLSANAYTIIYPIASVFSVFIATLLFEKMHKQRKFVLILTILINIGILAALKYSNFFIYNILSLGEILHLHINLQPVHWIASLGISFYTLQMISYLCDNYWGIIPTERNIFKLMLFGCWFPQMVSGPISRHGQIAKQLIEEHSFDFTRVTFGLQRMLMGFFKKFIIADRLALFVNTIYATPVNYEGMYIWLATFAFTMQLYTNFSGCMDILLGASECFGIKMPENFRTPFFSQSIKEFWQRWHITLGTWLKDYIMYPLLKSESLISIGDWCKQKFGKQQGKKIPVYIALLALWLAMGMWHGSSWKYIVGEGLWFWFVIVLGEIFNPYIQTIVDKTKINTELFVWKSIRMLRTFLIFSVGMLFFRANSFLDAINMIKLSFKPTNWDVFFSNNFFTIGLDLYNWIVCIVGFLTLLIIGILQEYGSARQFIANRNIILRWAVYFIIIFGIIILGKYGPGVAANEFIYKGF